jgi:hypothetical protein
MLSYNSDNFIRESCCNQDGCRFVVAFEGIQLLQEGTS